MVVNFNDLPRRFLGTSAELSLNLAGPEGPSTQIHSGQRALRELAFLLIASGQQAAIARSVGPLSFLSLRSLVPPESEIGWYLEQLSRLEPQKETPTLAELIKDYDHMMVLLGMKASGKGTVSQIMRDDYGFPGMPTSDWLRAVAAARGCPEPFNPVMLRELGDELRGKFGGEALVWLTLREYALKGMRNIVFDGLRTEAEMTQLIKQPNTAFVWIGAPDQKRLERVRSRNRPGDPQTIEALGVVDAKSFPEAQRLRALCPHTINNPGDDMTDLRTETDALMNRLSVRKPRIRVV
ncbi:MAG: hypothetical protein M1342_01570 [Patescibacteria group bacterium]|nr:hypothetical protein [Patescibacteria group bacterium]